MITKQEMLEDCKAMVHFSYDGTKIAPIVDDIAAKIGKEHTIKGFRKGHASVDDIKLALRKPILNEAVNKLANEAFQDILFETKWKPFGPPKFVDVKIDYDHFDAQVVVAFIPDIELKEYVGLEVDKPNVPDVEFVKQRMTEQLCSEHSTKVPFTEEDFLLSGDDAIVNYYGTLNGKEFHKNKEEGLLISLGKNQLIEPIEEQFLGMRVGEKKSFDIDATVIGQEGTLHFDVEVVAASKVTPGVLNDDLAQQVGAKDLQDIELNINTQAQQYLNNLVTNQLREPVMNLLIQKNDFNLPNWMVLESAGALAMQQNVKLAEFNEEERAQFLAEASGRLRLSMLLEKIKEVEPDVVLEDHELVKTIEQNFGVFPKNIQEELKKGNQNVLLAVMQDVQADHILKWVANRVVFKETNNGQDQKE